MTEADIEDVHDVRENQPVLRERARCLRWVDWYCATQRALLLELQRGIESGAEPPEEEKR